MLRKENAITDDILKMLIPEDSMLSRKFFGLVGERWGPHIVDIFSTGANTYCDKFYTLH